MITASELRIGNWIELKNSGFVKVDADNIGDIVNNPYIFEPIPLTPEILQQCGLNQMTNTKMFYKEFENGNYLQIADNEISLGGNDSSTGGMTFNIECKYVHQLQNLYFTLTGEELNIEL